jgi:peptide/nickel transport system substrate-binding protein
MKQPIAAELKPIQEIQLITWTKNQYPVQYEEAFMIAENWKKLGLKVRVDPQNWPNPMMDNLLQAHNFDTVVMYMTATPERLELDFYTYQVFHSSNTVPGALNVAGFIDKDFDKLVETARVEYDVNKRRALGEQLQAYLYRENPWIIIVNQDELQAYNKENFKDPGILIGGFKDYMPFFTIKPTGDRKILRWGLPWSDLKTISPLLVTDSTQVRIIYLIYDMLVRLGPGGTPQLWAAKEIKVIDQKTIDVTIREDLKFHDGKPLTAEDVKFTVDFMIKYKAPYYTACLGPVESVDILDKYKVRFHLKNPYAPFITNTLGMVPLLPKHIWEKIEKPREYRNVPAIGSGPLKFDYWREGRELKMSRFSDHFKPTNVDGVLAIFYGTREALYTALIKKEIDVLDYLLAHQMEEAKEYKYIQTLAIPSNSVDSLILNLRRKPFNDSKFRLAIAHTIPKQEILEELYGGYGNLGASVIAPANKYWHDPRIKPYPFDLKMAREILGKAGYQWDSNGRLCYPPE